MAQSCAELVLAPRLKGQRTVVYSDPHPLEVKNPFQTRGEAQNSRRPLMAMMMSLLSDKVGVVDKIKVSCTRENFKNTTLEVCVYIGDVRLPIQVEQISRLLRLSLEIFYFLALV